MRPAARRPRSQNATPSIERLHAQLDTADHYTLLGVGYQADDASIADAWKRRKELCVGPMCSDDAVLAWKAAAVFAALDTARTVLTDAGRRRAYDERTGITPPAPAQSEVRALRDPEAHAAEPAAPAVEPAAPVAAEPAPAAEPPPRVATMRPPPMPGRSGNIKVMAGSLRTARLPTFPISSGYGRIAMGM